MARNLTYRHDPIQLTRIDAAAVRDMGYYSQDGQDVLLDRHVFAAREHGLFAEVGAYDGVTFSNTYYLESIRGWRGLCVEPNPEAFEACRQARQSVSINAAISDREGTAGFLRVSGNAAMLSGLTDTMDDRHLRRVERDRTDGDVSEVIQVPTARLDALLRDHGFDRLDLLVVDVEGAELDVLASIDLTTVDEPIVLIENNYRDRKIPTSMHRHGYRCLLRIGRDELYVPRSTLSNWAVLADQNLSR